MREEANEEKMSFNWKNLDNEVYGMVIGFTFVTFVLWLAVKIVYY